MDKHKFVNIELIQSSLCEMPVNKTKQTLFTHPSYCNILVSKTFTFFHQQFGLDHKNNQVTFKMLKEKLVSHKEYFEMLKILFDSALELFSLALVHHAMSHHQGLNSSKELSNKTDKDH